MKILFVDPRETSRDALRRAFAALGASVRGFGTLTEAEGAVADFSPELLVAALDATDGDAAAFLRRAKAADPRRSAIVLVDSNELDRAVAAVGAGADDFLWRPISEARVAQLLAAADARRRTEREAERTRLALARAQ